MNQYSFEEIKEKLLNCIEKGFEAELRLYLSGKEYMIIIYDDHCSFSRCGKINECQGNNFNSLDELYISKQVDGIVLKEDWNKIEEMECDEFDILDLW